MLLLTIIKKKKQQKTKNYICIIVLFSNVLIKTKPTSNQPTNQATNPNVKLMLAAIFLKLIKNHTISLQNQHSKKNLNYFKTKLNLKKKNKII